SRRNKRRDDHTQEGGYLHSPCESGRQRHLQPSAVGDPELQCDALKRLEEAVADRRLPSLPSSGGSLRFCTLRQFMVEAMKKSVATHLVSSLLIERRKPIWAVPQSGALLPTCLPTASIS